MVTGDTIQILLVEDNDVDSEAIERAFKRLKLANPVTVARDGREALDVLRGTNGTTKIPRPYMILLDLNMPRMNGLEFLTELRADADIANSIVFVLTTSDRDQDKVDAYGHRVAGYMVKTKVESDFVDMVNMIDAFWRVVEFPPKAN